VVYALAVGPVASGGRLLWVCRGDFRPAAVLGGQLVGCVGVGVCVLLYGLGVCAIRGCVLFVESVCEYWRLVGAGSVRSIGLVPFFFFVVFVLGWFWCGWGCHSRAWLVVESSWAKLAIWGSSSPVRTYLRCIRDRISA